MYVRPIMLADVECLTYQLKNPRYIQIVFNLILGIHVVVNRQLLKEGVR